MNEINTDSVDINHPFTGPHKVELESWISCAPFEKHLGMEIIEAKNGQSVLTMPFIFELAQGKGLVHGGAIVSLADTAVAMAVKTIVAPESRFGTISLTSEFLSPVTKGTLTAKASVKLSKNRTVQGFSTVFNDQKKEVMTFMATFKLAHDAKVLI